MLHMPVPQAVATRAHLGALRTPKLVWHAKRVSRPPRSQRRLKCLPGSADAFLGDGSKTSKEKAHHHQNGSAVDSDEAVALRKRVAELEERLEAAEGSLTQLSEQMRDHAVSVMSAIQDQNTSDKVAHNVDEQDKDQLDLDGVMARFTEVMVKGYLEAVTRLRDKLLVTEWELTLKPLAMRQGVSAFEKYITENQIKDVSYEELSALYEDPTDLEVIKDPLLRMRARACINQASVTEHQRVYEQCSEQAQQLAGQFSQGDFISKILPEGGVLEAFKGAVVTAGKAVLPGN